MSTRPFSEQGKWRLLRARVYRAADSDRHLGNRYILQNRNILCAMSTSRTTSTAHTVESEGALANGKSLFLVAVPQHILNLKEDQAATLKKTQDFYRELIENNRGKMTPAEREHWDKGRKANTIFIPRPDEVSQECRLEYWERCTEYVQSEYLFVAQLLQTQP